MPLHPQARAALDKIAERGGPPIEQQPIGELRTQLMSDLGELTGNESVAAVEDRMIPGPERDFCVRIYTPEESTRPLPILLSYHSGGFILGGIHNNDGLARSLANGAKAIVVSPDYALAPEHPFPNGVEDCYATARWVHEHAEEFGGDPNRIAVQGCSAGATLAITTALLAKRRGGPPILMQVVAYPPTDATESLPSVVENGEGFLLTHAMIKWSYAHYIGDRGLEREPLVSPIFATDLEGMPPCLLFTAEFDPLRDEGELYGKRLEEAGVEVTCRRYDGMIHGWFEMVTEIDAAQTAIDEACHALQKAFSVG